MSEDPEDTDAPTTVRRLWAALSRRDWPAVAAQLAPDCIYLDVPTGSTLAAKGPEDVVKRLRIGLGGLAEYRNYDGLLVCDGDTVMYEHAETWVWHSGERVELPFVTVHRLAGGRIRLWKDYWNFQTVVTAAPSTWLEDFASADMSWIYDATDDLAALDA